MIDESMFPIVMVAIVIFIFPQAWREDNSWWFAIIKFWFGIAPFMMAALGGFAVLVGPIMALYGLFNWEAFPVTLFYLYVIAGWIILEKLPESVREKLRTL